MSSASDKTKTDIYITTLERNPTPHKKIKEILLWYNDTGLMHLIILINISIYYFLISKGKLKTQTKCFFGVSALVGCIGLTLYS